MLFTLYRLKELVLMSNDTLLLENRNNVIFILTYINMYDQRLAMTVILTDPHQALCNVLRNLLQQY